MSETVSSGVQPYMFELESENGAYRARKKMLKMAEKMEIEQE